MQNDIVRIEREDEIGLICPAKLPVNAQGVVDLASNDAGT